MAHSSHRVQLNQLLSKIRRHQETSELTGKTINTACDTYVVRIVARFPGEEWDHYKL